jgi:hypothetical protein
VARHRAVAQQDDLQSRQAGRQADIKHGDPEQSQLSRGRASSRVCGPPRPPQAGWLPRPSRPAAARQAGKGAAGGAPSRWGSAGRVSPA